MIAFALSTALLQVFAQTQSEVTSIRECSHNPQTAVKSLPNMSDIVVTGNNDTVVIDDKDTITKTVNKTVNITKSDTSQIETDIKAIQADVTRLLTSMSKHTTAMSRIEKKVDRLITKLNSLPVATTQQEVNDE